MPGRVLGIVFHVVEPPLPSKVSKIGQKCRVKQELRRRVTFPERIQATPLTKIFNTPAELHALGLKPHQLGFKCGQMASNVIHPSGNVTLRLPFDIRLIGSTKYWSTVISLLKLFEVTSYLHAIKRVRSILFCINLIFSIWKIHSSTLSMCLKQINYIFPFIS